MNLRSIGIAALAIALCGTIPVVVAESKLEVQAADTVKSVLERQAGKTVTLRLAAGEEITGKVTKVGDRIVHLSELAGKEYFDAVVPLEVIHAVVVRAR